MTPRSTPPAALSAFLAMLAILAGAGLAMRDLGTGSPPAFAEAVPAATDSGGARAADTGPGDPIRGKVVYEKNCVSCHKQDGTGGIKSVATGNPTRNFRDPAFWKNHTDAQLRKSIETGFPKSGMMSWKGVLKPEEIRNAVAYVRARFQPKGAAPAPPNAKAKIK